MRYFSQLRSSVEALAAQARDVWRALGKTSRFALLSAGAILCLAGIVEISSPHAEDEQPEAKIKFGTFADADLGVVASLNGNIPFPSDNAWNQDISDPVRYPVDKRSDAIVAQIGAGTGLHADFGPAPYGIPYIVVDEKQPLATVQINQTTGFENESDVGQMPIPPDAPLEGGPDSFQSGHDTHLIVFSRTPMTKFNASLFELYRARKKGSMEWEADSSAVFDISSNLVRPTTEGRCNVTSADAAGLPIFPGLVRYDEVQSGNIRHALRFTVESTRRAFIPPAKHWGSTVDTEHFSPMGMRVRLKSSYVIPENFSKETKVILEALKTYGMIVADNGSNWFITGTMDERWEGKKLFQELKRVKGSNFEVLDMSAMQTECGNH